MCMTNKNTTMTTKTQNTDNQSVTQIDEVSSTDNQVVTYFVLGNDYDGDIFESNNLLDVIAFLGGYELKSWYNERLDFIPLKSNFEINEREINSWNKENKQKTIIKIKAKKLFNL